MPPLSLLLLVVAAPEKVCTDVACLEAAAKNKCAPAVLRGEFSGKVGRVGKAHTRITWRLVGPGTGGLCVVRFETEALAFEIDPTMNPDGGRYSDVEAQAVSAEHLAVMKRNPNKSKCEVDPLKLAAEFELELKGGVNSTVYERCQVLGCSPLLNPLAEGCTLGACDDDLGQEIVCTAGGQKRTCRMPPGGGQMMGKYTVDCSPNGEVRQLPVADQPIKARFVRVKKLPAPSAGFEGWTAGGDAVWREVKISHASPHALTIVTVQPPGKGGERFLLEVAASDEAEMRAVDALFATLPGPAEYEAWARAHPLTKGTPGKAYVAPSGPTDKVKVVAKGATVRFVLAKDNRARAGYLKGSDHNWRDAIDGPSEGWAETWLSPDGKNVAFLSAKTTTPFGEEHSCQVGRY